MANTEQVFDMLPHAIGIYEKLNLRKIGSNVTELILKNRPGIKRDELNKVIAEEMLMYILKESPKVKEEFFALVAIAASTTVEEAKRKPIGELMGILKDTFLDKEIWAFFKQAMQ